jgi:4'-phosphopantetheinyl transferase
MPSLISKSALFTLNTLFKMPQVLRKSHNSGAELIVWEVTESEDFFLANLSKLVWKDEEFVKTKFAAKRLELLAARYAAKVIVTELGGDFNGIAKDEYGKPYLVDNEWEMSLTHTSKYVAVALHKSQKIGVDLEKPSAKMWRIQKRLFSSEEIAAINNDLSTMSIYWSAKEALYKIYGKRGMDFMENMSLQQTTKGFIGNIKMPDCESIHQVYSEKFKEYILVWLV